MPWLTWTTGSPTLSSERSLISALTSLVCSWRRRRRAPGAIANSSVSVTNSIVAASLLPSVVARKALRQRRDRDREALAAGFELGQRRDARRLDPAVAQQLEQALAPALALGDDQDAMRRRRDVALQAL